MPKQHNAAPLSGPVPSKVCGGPCKQRLPLTDYPVNNQRKDKRGLYCKSCVRAMVKQCRDNLKQYNEAKHLRALNRERQERIAAAAVSACEVNKKDSAVPYCAPCSACQEWLWQGVITSGLCAPRL